MHREIIGRAEADDHGPLGRDPDDRLPIDSRGHEVSASISWSQRKGPEQLSPREAQHVRRVAADPGADAAR
jgi:hypothetical protein